MWKTWPGGPNTRTRSHGGASFIWASPWVRVRAFGPPGQVFLIFIALMCHFAYGFPHGYGRWSIELPLTTINSRFTTLSGPYFRRKTNTSNFDTLGLRTMT